MAEEMNSRGQITIWIILALILIFSFVLFLMLQKEVIPSISEPDEISADALMKQCVEESVEEATRIMLPQGGFISPRNYVLFNETNVEYLCENAGFYSPCINQHPVLINEMEKEIINYITPKISVCFDELKSEVEKNGNEIEMDFDEPRIILEMKEDKIFVKIEKEVRIKESEQTRTIPSFSFEVGNSAYNLAVIAMEIAAQEADYCYFEYVGYRILYPRYSIVPFTMSRPVTIYQIKDTKTNEFMNIAIRSCAIPAGI